MSLSVVYIARDATDEEPVAIFTSRTKANAFVSRYKADQDLENMYEDCGVYLFEMPLDGKEKSPVFIILPSLTSRPPHVFSSRKKARTWGKVVSRLIFDGTYEEIILQKAKVVS